VEVDLFQVSLQMAKRCLEAARDFLGNGRYEASQKYLDGLFEQDEKGKDLRFYTQFRKPGSTGGNGNFPVLKPEDLVLRAGGNLLLSVFVLAVKENRGRFIVTDCKRL
jgi:hypothetical protein